MKALLEFKVELSVLHWSLRYFLCYKFNTCMTLGVLVTHISWLYLSST